MKRNTKILIAIAGVLLIIVITFFTCKNDKKEQPVPITTKLTIGKVSSTVTATGTISPVKTVTVGTQVSGTISKIYVDYNSVVKKGQILAELDKTLLLSTLASAKSDLLTNKTQMDYQEKNFKRIKDLYAKQAVSQTDYETAEYNYETAKFNYQKSVASVKIAETNLGYATIYSPINGTVLSRAVDEGQTVAASFSTPTLFSIAQDLTKMQVIANVDEADIGNVRDGQRVSFTVDAYPNDVFSGSVMQVRLNATTTSNVVTYQVIINAPNDDLKLLPGLTANITIYTLEKSGIQILPNKALNFKPDAESLQQNGFTLNENKSLSANLGINEKIIWILNDKTLQNKKIEVGASDGIHTEIIAGVSANDAVVTEIKSLSKSEIASQASGETSPFMPKRPGSSNKKTSKGNNPPMP